MATVDKIVPRAAVQVGVRATTTQPRQNWLRIDQGNCVSWFKLTSAGWVNAAKLTQQSMEADYQKFLKGK